MCNFEDQDSVLVPGGEFYLDVMVGRNKAGTVFYFRDARAAMRLATLALLTVEWRVNENGDEHCPWCGNLSPAEFQKSAPWYKAQYPNGGGHAEDCPRQSALSAIRHYF